MTSPEAFLLMTLGAFLTFAGNVLLPQLLAKGLELIALPDWVKTVLSASLGAFFVALVSALAQSPVFTPYLDNTLLSLIFVIASALVSWASTLIGRANGLVLKAAKFEAKAKLA